MDEEMLFEDEAPLVDGAKVVDVYCGPARFSEGKKEGVRYRYTASLGEGGRLTVFCEIYRVLRRTPRGAWIGHYDYEEGRFVLDGDGKRFAHETRAMALRSFHRRSVWRQRHARRNLSIGALAEKWASLQLKKEKDHGTAR